MNILMSWVGHEDFRAAINDSADIGPLASALATGEYERAVLLFNVRDFESISMASYLAWLKKKTDVILESRFVSLESPNDREGIYRAAREQIRSLEARYGNLSLTFHLSPGTKAMSQMWLLLAAQHGCSMIDSSKEAGVVNVKMPFEISAYFLPDRKVEKFVHPRVPPNPAFTEILYKSEAMEKAARQALILAPKDVPVLIQGESGTGKELFARAIHNASPRATQPFITVNCGAIPETLVESEVFGHEKGAFTHAVKTMPGYFDQAEKGTLFLDEFGELPVNVQVKLLRALNDGEIRPVGGKARKADVRIIAATNRDLLEEVAAGRFRSDLLYRIAIGIIHLSPLRESPDDLALLIDEFLKKANVKMQATKPQYVSKRLSGEAKKMLMTHAWPGNARELESTIYRAVVWTPDNLIDADAISAAILKIKRPMDILDEPLGGGFKLEELLAKIEKHYIYRALTQSKTLTDASKLLGYTNYQTLANRLNKYKI